MSQPRIKNISIFPIKSAAGIDISTAWIDNFGLSFDRRFVLSDPQGQFITARTHPTLCLIKVQLTAGGLVLNAPGMPVLKVSYQVFSSHYQSVNVWKDTISAQHCLVNYDQWFSDYLKTPCQLLFFGENSQRAVVNSKHQVAFADGYPLLLISQSSLTDLNQRMGLEFPMRRFRPNLVVENTMAFAEDSWQRIRIGEVEFELAKPCSRCIFTTVDPLTGIKHPQKEPLNTLAKYRQVEGGDVMFGQNLIPLTQGSISEGDVVEVIEKKSPPVFISHSSQTTTDETKAEASVKKQVSKAKLTIDYTSKNKVIAGNNQQTILEQGEAAGLIMRFSCRAGMCGACRVKLQSGDVEQLANDGLSKKDQERGYILACSCIPQSDIVISDK